MFFRSWEEVWRVAAVAALAYPIMIVFLRLSGKRTLAKMNAFDLVITVALGSSLATILLSTDVALAEGITGLAMLVALQLVATWLSVRFRAIRRALKSEPTLLARHGRLLTRAMRAQRVTEDEILQAMRTEGVGDVAMVAAVVLETDGTFSVIPAAASDAGTSLASVKGWHAQDAET